MTLRPSAAAATALGILVSLVGALGGAPARTSEAMTPAAAEQAVLATVAPVEEIRGLSFKQPVSVKVVSDAVARQHILDRLEKFYSGGQIEAQQQAYIALGLLPEGTDVLEEFLEVMEEQAGGFYDPGTESFFLLEDMPAVSAPMLAAHELTHALEDQYYDLDGRLERALPNDDLMFAVSAVHEGSAMLVMSVYTLQALADGSLTEESLQAMGETEAARGDKLAKMPPALQRQLLGPYVLGMSFLLRGDPQRIADGYPKEDVDFASTEGPQSSEQILHPEKFWSAERRDPPTAIAPFKANKVLGRKWKRIASGNLGELVIAVMAGATTPSGLAAMTTPNGSEWTNEAAQGWDGDRWEIWRREESSAVLLSTVWDSPRDAEEFAAALDPDSRLRFEVRGNRVAVVAADVDVDAARLLDRMLGDGS